MDILQSNIAAQLNKLKSVISILSPNVYSQKSRYLGDSSIGAHVRHIIELINCVENGYTEGVVDYQNRVRDLRLETDVHLALEQIDMILKAPVKSDKIMYVFESSVSQITSTYFRELLYQMEHAIHHMALMQVALREFDIQIDDKHFGFAYSTIAYQKQCAQ